MKFKNSYNESWYKGKYEYEPDKNHIKWHKLNGPGWYLTSKGWARGSGAKNKPSKILVNPQDTVPSQHHCNRLLANSKKISPFVSSGITYFKSASNEVISQIGDMRDVHYNFDNMIIKFADNKMAKFSSRISSIMGYVFSLSPDFRNQGKRIMDYDENLIKNVKEYIIFEQEVIRMTGLVNDDDTITLFRNTDARQFLSQDHEFGSRVKYHGNNFESWTTNPNLTLSIDDKHKMKICARVPLHACVASCIGRKKGREFMYKDDGECEIMVCGAFIESALIVGDMTGIKLPGFRNNYCNDCKDNMINFAKKHKWNKNRRAKMCINYRILAIAKRIISSFFKGN